MSVIYAPLSRYSPVHIPAAGVFLARSIEVEFLVAKPLIDILHIAVTDTINTLQTLLQLLNALYRFRYLLISLRLGTKTFLRGYLTLYLAHKANTLTAYVTPTLLLCHNLLNFVNLSFANRRLYIQQSKDGFSLDELAVVGQSENIEECLAIG